MRKRLFLLNGAVTILFSLKVASLTIKMSRYNLPSLLLVCLHSIDQPYERKHSCKGHSIRCGAQPVPGITASFHNPASLVQSFGKQHAFKICSSKPLYLVAEDDQSRNDWISAVVALKGTENPSHGSCFLFVNHFNGNKT